MVSAGEVSSCKICNREIGKWLLEEQGTWEVGSGLLEKCRACSLLVADLGKRWETPG